MLSFNLHLIEDVDLIQVLVDHISDIFASLVVGQSAFLGNNLRERCVDTIAHRLRAIMNILIRLL